MDEVCWSRTSTKQECWSDWKHFGKAYFKPLLFRRGGGGFDNETVLAAGVKMVQVIRANQGLPTTPQRDKMYSKSRTSLAERTIQTVRVQGKCLIAFLEDKMKMKNPEGHVLHGWALVHAGWLLDSI